MTSVSRPKVVAVSGGFDPIHVGHVRLFEAAKKLGNTLVVILNNDNWLRKKKKHIFMKEVERKAVLEALGCVDRVILSKHKKNPIDMSVSLEIKSLKPDMFANGGDRKKGTIPEAEVCKKIGTKLVFNVGDANKFQSSSELLEGYFRSRLEDHIRLRT